MFTLIYINCKVTSKEDLISSTIQDIFKETMEEFLFCFKKTSFIEAVSIFHEKLYTVSEEYNNFILNHFRITSKENRGLYNRKVWLI